MKKEIKDELERAYQDSKSYTYTTEEWGNEEWDKIKVSRQFGMVKDTGVSLDVLRDIGDKITTLPDDWEIHPQVKKIYELRKKSIAEGKGIDWGTAEALAFATLIHEGFHIRLSG